MYANESDRTQTLLKIYRRDIEENLSLVFRGKRIYPTKDEDGEQEMGREFIHLTREEVEEEQPDGKKIKRRVFDMFRSQRLHWIEPHLMETTGESDIEVFSVNQTEPRTIIYNRKMKYVVVLLPQKRSKGAYYLLTAYYLNKDYGTKQIEKQFKKRLGVIY